MAHQHRASSALPERGARWWTLTLVCWAARIAKLVMGVFSEWLALVPSGLQQCCVSHLAVRPVRQTVANRYASLVAFAPPERAQVRLRSVGRCAISTAC